MLRGEAGVYYEDLYPLVCFLPRYSTHAPEAASDEDMLPLWRASAMDAQKHKTAHTFTSSRPLSPNGSGHDQTSVKELGELSEDQIYHSLRGRQQKKKFDPEAALPVVYSEHPLQPARNPPQESLFDYLPFLRIFKLLARPFRRRKSEPELPTTASGPTRSLTGKRLRPEAVDSNVPLEITLFLSSYLAWLLRNGQLQPAVASAFTSGIVQLQDTVSNLDRIRNTPLPFAYQAHLRISLWLYLFFLPVSSRSFPQSASELTVAAAPPRHLSSKSGPLSAISPSRTCLSGTENTPFADSSPQGHGVRVVLTPRFPGDWPGDVRVAYTFFLSARTKSRKFPRAVRTRSTMT